MSDTAKVNTAGRIAARAAAGGGGGGTVRQRRTGGAGTTTRARTTGGGGGGGAGGGAGLWRFYTEDSTGLKIGPVPVLVLSMVFIASVFVLHLWGKYSRSHS